MEAQLDRLVWQTWEMYKRTPISARLLIGISGIPGSGKTTLAHNVTERLNRHYVLESPAHAHDAVASHLSMDGYHLSRAQLSAMADPVTAHARRGAAFTFDASSFLRLVKDLRKPLTADTKTLCAPSFDHAVKDPVENDISIKPAARIIIFEGNYLSLNTGEWKEAGALMDQLWFVDVDIDQARKRLIERHVAAGLARDVEEATKRVDENDLVNGKEIMNGMVQVQEIIVSEEDENWRTNH